MTRAGFWSGRRRALGVGFLAGVIALSAATRIAPALRDPNFDRESPASLLRTDPALLYYITERIVEAGGRPPADFRADPRIEYPDGTDVPRTFTVGQEFVVAWTWLAHRALGGEASLHVVSVWVMGVFAALVAVGVYGLALELTGAVRWACLAALLWSALAVNYRTIGAILIREDFALPWFALHLYLLARAARVRTPLAFALSGLSLLAAVATWHAMSFVVAMEVACALAWFLRSGRNLLGAPGVWVLPVSAAAGSLLVPVLRAGQFALSLPMAAAWGLVAAGFAARRRGLSRAGETAVALAATALVVGLSALASSWWASGLADYSHVFELLLAKARHLGVLPDDPSRLSFGARLLWTGPFQTAPPAIFVQGLSTGSLALVAALVVYTPEWLRGRGDERMLLLVAFAALSAVAALLVERTMIILGFATPVLAACLLEPLRPRPFGIALMLAGIALPAWLLCSLLAGFESPWYLPPARNQERARLVQWIGENVGAGEPIAADFLNSAAILAHSRHPILQQPKYEAVRSRERIEAFFDAFYAGTPRDLHRHVRGYGARHLVVDRYVLMADAYIGGIPPSQSHYAPETAAAAFLSLDPAVFESIPGFTLLYRSAPDLGLDSYRVYRLD